MSRSRKLEGPSHVLRNRQHSSVACRRGAVETSGPCPFFVFRSGQPSSLSSASLARALAATPRELTPALAVPALRAQAPAARGARARPPDRAELRQGAPEQPEPSPALVGREATLLPQAVVEARAAPDWDRAEATLAQRVEERPEPPRGRVEAEVARAVAATSREAARRAAQGSPRAARVGTRAVAPARWSRAVLSFAPT